MTETQLQITYEYAENLCRNNWLKCTRKNIINQSLFVLWNTLFSEQAQKFVTMKIRIMKNAIEVYKSRAIDEKWFYTIDDIPDCYHLYM